MSQRGCNVKIYCVSCLDRGGKLSGELGKSTRREGIGEEKRKSHKGEEENVLG